jgi:ubiquinone/menaquinone biosynthesis C-methylase UbiE
MTNREEETYWSRFARRYDRAEAYVVGDDILEAITDRLGREHNLGETIELGCGTGYFTRVIAKRADHVVATDLSGQMVETARGELERFTNVTVQKVSAHRTPFSSGRFDTVLMANLVHVVENPLACLQEGYRILKTGGLILVVDFTNFGMRWSDKFRLVFRYLSKFGLPPRHGQSNLSPQKLGHLVTQAGFEIECVELIEHDTNALYVRGKKK